MRPINKKVAHKEEVEFEEEEEYEEEEEEYEEEEDEEEESDEEEELVNEEPPKDVDCYKVLGVEKTATADEVKKAYRKAALVHHPDKVKEEDKAAAHTTFQRIALAYAVLSTPHRRARYDATGRTDDSLYPGGDDDDGPFDWQSFYRAQFENAVTDATIENARNGYVGTEEEKADLLKAYEKVKGDMARIYQLVMFAEPWEDEERFRVIIDAAIKNEEVTGWKRYMIETPYDRERRIARAKRIRDGEAKELEDEKAKKAKKAGGKKGAQEFKVEGFGDLAAMIQQRQKARSGFFDRLEEAYTPASRGKKRQSEPPEEAFAAMGERMKKKSKQSKPDEAEEESEEAEEESEEEKPRPRRRLGRKKT